MSDRSLRLCRAGTQVKKTRNRKFEPEREPRRERLSPACRPQPGATNRLVLNYSLFQLHFIHDLDHLPAGEDADGGEEDDGYWVGGTQQPVAVKGRRDLLSQLLAQRHPGGRGQLPAIGENGAAEDGAPRGIQGPEGASHMTNQIINKCISSQVCLQIQKTFCAGLSAAS